MSLSDVYRCPSCGFDVADIDYATMDDYDCPACGERPLTQFELVEPEAVSARKRQEVKA